MLGTLDGMVEDVGHSIVDGESIAWKPGSAFESSMPRVAFGIRYLFEAMAKEEFPYLDLAYRHFAGGAARERERVRERAR